VPAVIADSTVFIWLVQQYLDSWWIMMTWLTRLVTGVARRVFSIFVHRVHWYWRLEVGFHYEIFLLRRSISFVDDSSSSNWSSRCYEELKTRWAGIAPKFPGYVEPMDSTRVKTPIPAHGWSRRLGATCNQHSASRTGQLVSDMLYQSQIRGCCRLSTEYFPFENSARP
jgi:hypothetical protein